MKKRILIYFPFLLLIQSVTAQCPPLEPIEGLTEPAMCLGDLNHIYSVPNGGPAGLEWTLTPWWMGLIIGSGESVTVDFINTGATQLCATPTNPCFDPTPVCIDLNVVPVPEMDDPPDITVCSGDFVSVHFTSSDDWKYYWDSQPFVNDCNIGLPPGQTGNGDLEFIADNNGNMPETCLFAVVPHQEQASCYGYAELFSVTVLPDPTFQPPDVTVCGGDLVSVIFGDIQDATYSWTNDNSAIGLPAAGTGNIIYISPKVQQQEVAHITVTSMVTHYNLSCPGEIVTFTITLNGVAVNDPPDITVCPGEPVSVAFSGNGDSYTWTNSNTFIGLDDSGTGDIAFIAQGSSFQQTATVTVTPQPCPFAPQTFKITVLPLPQVNDPPDTALCAGKPLNVNFWGTPGATFAWTNSNTAIGLGVSGTGNISFTASNVSATQTALITVTPVTLVNGCVGEPQVFSITVVKCCATSAGALDTNAIALCGPKTVEITQLGNQNLEPGDTIRYILYSNPAIPLGSIVQYADTLYFPFLQGVMHFDSIYYAAAIAGNQMANDSIDTADPCFSLVNGPKVLWRSIPTISVGSPPASVCADGCADVLFTFTGTPPFEFTWLIEQGGQILLLKTETSDIFQKIVAVCPADFVQPGTGGYLNFQVNFLMDKFCGCGD